MIGTLLLALAPLPAPQGDSFEPNDTCQTAVFAPLDTYNEIQFGGGGPTGATDDWFFVDVGAGESLLLDTIPGTIFSWLLTGILVEVYDDGCGAVLATGTGRDSLVIPGSMTQAVRLRIRYRALPSLEGTVLFRARAAVDPCSAIGPDMFEPNDIVATTGALVPGAVLNLTIDRHSSGALSDIDLFRFTVPPYTTGTVTIASPAIGPFEDSLYVRMVEPTTNVPVDTTFVLPGIPASVSVETLGQSAEYDLVVVGLQGDCAVYTAELVHERSPCAAAASDAFELGETCGAGAFLPLGMTTDLVIDRDDIDPYTLALQAPLNRASDVTVRVVPTSGTVSNALRGAIRAGCQSPTSPLQPQADGTLLGRWSRQAGEPRSLEINLELAGTEIEVGCVFYDVIVEESLSPIARPYCDSGSIQLVASGSLDVTEDALRVTLIQGGVSELYRFAQPLIGLAPARRSLPFGVLCVGGGITRLADGLQDAGFLSDEQIPLAVPLLTGPLAGTALPGTTLYCQAYVRTLTGTPSLSTAVAIELR